MRLLTNYPLELHGPREDYPFTEIRTFGPSAGRVLGDIVVPYDVAFDASRQSYDELLQSLGDFAPDAVMLWWPDQDPIPEGLEHATVPTIAVVSDYNLTLPIQRGLAPFFDLVLCDHSALPVLGRLPFADVQPWCQYSFRPDVHRADPNCSRDLDITFLGNLHPVVQRTRLPWIRRIQALGDRFRVHVGQACQGREYGSVLARSRIAFNRSIRGEVNLRCFEATACGALLFCERENLEIRNYFVEDEEVVLYGPEDLEQKLCWFLEHESTRAKIAAAGERRVQEHRLARLAAPLPERFARIDTRRRPTADPVTRLLGRGESMLLGRCDPEAAVQPFLDAHRVEESTRTRNALAVALCTRLGEEAGGDQARELLSVAHNESPEHLPTLANLARCEALRGDAQTARRLRDQLAELTWTLDDPACFDGLVLPLGFQSRAIGHSQAWIESLQSLSLAPLRTYFGLLARDTDPRGAMPGFEPAFETRTLANRAYDAPSSLAMS